LLDRLDLFVEAERVNFASGRLREMGLDPGVVMAVDRVRKHLGAQASPPARSRRRALQDEEIASARGQARTPALPGDNALLISILAGYPDRVAKRRTMKGDNFELLLSGGGAATLSPASVVRQSEFLVAVDAEERRDKGRLIRIASEIKPEWLIDLFAD